MNSSTFRTIATFVLIGLIVICLGALAGWYFVLRAQNNATKAADAARGFGTDAPTANINGSTFQNSSGATGAGGIGNGSGVGGTQGTTGFGTNGGGGIENGTSGTETGAGALGSGGINGDTTGTGTSTNNSGSTGPTKNPPAAKPLTPRLWHASKTPVAGYGFGTASSSNVFYAERLGGYIFRGNMFSGEILRLSNTLKPKTYEAQFSRSGAAILRTVNEKTGTIETFSGSISAATSTAPGTLGGVDLKANIANIASSPDVTTVFFTVQQGDTTVGMTSLRDGSREKKIFTSPLASWKPILLADGKLIIVQKAHDGISGYAYEIKSDGTWNPLIRGISGLTILPVENSSTLLYGAATNSSVSLYLKKAGEANPILLPLKTTADKCVWAPHPSRAPRGSPPPTLVAYCAVPDSIPSGFLQKWFQGETHTSDSWWRIDGTTGETTQVMKASKQDGFLDVIDPVIDPSGSFIAFKNNADASLWVLRIAP